MANSRRVRTKMSPSDGGGADEARGESVGKPMNPRAVKTPKRAPSLDRASGGLLSPEISSGPGQIQPGTVRANPGYGQLDGPGNLVQTMIPTPYPLKPGGECLTVDTVGSPGEDRRV